MRTVTSTLTSSLIAALLLPAPQRAAELLGFAPQRAASQLELERRFDATLDASSLEDWSRRMTVRPHHVGSEQAEANARFMAELFDSWGFETEIETFWVLFPRPRLRELVLLEPQRYEARLQEEVIPGDRTSQLAIDEGLPPYNAYSADGDVTAELVYVNRGVPADYEELERRGIEVRGKIVIARYGGSWRGIKPKVAAEKGAVGCLIYNDPADDGYSAGVTYPEGAFKHSWGVQRGSVLDLPRRAGDPLTPGIGATRDAPRLDRAEADTLMPIPVLPLAWRDAQPLLEAIAGPVAPESWRGALPITYRLGPGPARVRLRLEFDWQLAPAHNVIARLAGGERPDQWIVRGNHHDAWVIGARDPISGMVALLLEARGVGRLAATGWRPKRTLVYAAWDAEEPALLGSTEWAEHHAEELRQKAAVYLNSDSNGRGFLYAGGSHALETLVNQVAGAVIDPQTGASVAERLRARLLVGAQPEEAHRLLSGGELRLAALGSGSDYTPFLQHLGVASLNLGFGGEGSGGEYHTAFDSFDHYTRFVDPGFPYGVTLAQLAGRLVLRLLEADVLPFDFRATATTVGRYVAELEELADRQRQSIELDNRRVREGHYRLTADPSEAWVEPALEPPAPHLSFAPLLNARDRLERAAVKISWPALLAREEPPATELLKQLDRLSFSSERLLLREHGLPRRPWYRHHLYAPGFYTGYGVKTVPGVREAIEEGRWQEAQEQIAVAALLLEELAERLESIAALLAGTE